jgi:hypothetical protein
MFLILLFAVVSLSVQAASFNTISASKQMVDTSLNSLVPGEPLIIDHRSIELFDQIPESYLLAAQAMQFVFMDRSVGSNINDGLTCLSYPNWASSPSHCRRTYVDNSHTQWKTFTTRDTNIPSEINFPGGYNRDNIEFLMGTGTWEQDLESFIQMFPNYADRDVFTFQHNYLHVAAGSTIDDVYFDPNYEGGNILDLLDLEAQYPNKQFVYWTTSLAKTVGTSDAQSFNDQMRSWATTNGKILLDVADIESHALDGSVCQNEQGYDVICDDYTTETEGGHLGSVSAGKIRIAKAIWVLLAQMSGWNPDGENPQPTQQPTALPTVQPTNIPPAGPTVTPTSMPTVFPTVLPTSMPTSEPTTLPTANPTPTTVVPPSQSSMIIDHHTVALYDRIPPQYLRAAEQLQFTFMDRSVGSNINDGLTCLSYSNWADSPSHCRRSYLDDSLTSWKTYTSRDSNIPEVIQFPGGNNRSNIEFLIGMGTWEEDLENFINLYPNYTSRDIFTFQHNYLHVAAGSTIDDVYFDPNYNGTNIFDMLALEAAYPQNTFVYWTTSLARTVGTSDAQSFNDQMRSWALSNEKILLDVADIESHRPDGSACVNAQGYEVICSDYTTESEGGHLGSVSGGKIQIAKAIWVMLAQIAGWVP